MSEHLPDGAILGGLLLVLTGVYLLFGLPWVLVGSGLSLVAFGAAVARWGS